MKALLQIGTMALAAGGASAHEYWIEAEDYTLPEGGTLTATARVGQEFVGNPQAYLPTDYRRFEVVRPGAAPEAPDMRMGDRNLVAADLPEGLVTLVEVTRDYDLTWDSWEKFVSFLEHKDAEWVLDAHAERGLPEADVTEIYVRYAKALVAVGAGEGSDAVRGLETEIVALENPYTGETSDGLDVEVLYQGEPRTDAQVEVFARDPEGAVEITTVQTDGQGRATVPVAPGHTYLLDAVTVREPAGDAAMWETLWASLTFAVPE